MSLNFTYLTNKVLCFCFKNKSFFALFVLCSLTNAALANPGNNDSVSKKRPAVITNLDQCKIPEFMVKTIRHLSPSEIVSLNEEYQQTALDDNGEEVMITVRLRFMDDHISGYIKEAPIDNSLAPQTLTYIDIPVEWMCIQPKEDHPFHFSSSIADLDAIKEENGCLGWVQRGSEPQTPVAIEKTKKKSKNTKTN